MKHWALYRMTEVRATRLALGWDGAKKACMLAGRSESFHARAFFGHYGF